MVATLVVVIEEAEYPVVVETSSASLGSPALVEKLPIAIEHASSTTMLESPVELLAPH